MCAPALGVAARRGFEVAHVFRARGEVYRRTHRLARGQARAMRAIETCRTAALGGYAETCDRCGAVRVTYRSCRNRHCPKCQTLAKVRWVEARRADLLPIPYFHVVFTLPHALNALAQGNPRVIYRLLFQAAAETLLVFGRDPRYLGGLIGITAILHTWGQTLTQHLHLHCVVTGGALTADLRRWVVVRPRFLFPVRALSAVFRGKYLDALREAFHAQQLAFAGGTAGLAEPRAVAAFLAALRADPWVVYAKPPFGGAEQVLEYLGRYTHRVAIANHRLVDLGDDLVRFRWRDYADGNRVKVMTLAADEFIRRFLLHVMARGACAAATRSSRSPCHGTPHDAPSPSAAPHAQQRSHGDARGPRLSCTRSGHWLNQRRAFRADSWPPLNPKRPAGAARKCPLPRVPPGLQSPYALAALSHAVPSNRSYPRAPQPRANPARGPRG